MSASKLLSARPQDSARKLALLFAGVAVISVAAAIYFWQDRNGIQAKLAAAEAAAARNEQNFQASKAAIAGIVSGLADALGNRDEKPAEQAQAVLGKVGTEVGSLAEKASNDMQVRRGQAAMYVRFSSVYLALGNAALALDVAKKGTEIFRALAAAQPNNNDVQSDIGLSLEKLAEAARANGDFREALAADRESLDIAKTVAAKDPGNKQLQLDVVLALWRLASAGDDPRERLTEALKMLKHLQLAAMLSPSQEEWIGMIESDLAKL